MKAQIVTARFILRELRVEDVTERYLQWFRDPDATKHIVSAATTTELSGLRQYVRERAGRADVLFLGIFDRITGVHVGNIKYEPVNRAGRSAIMGVFVGDPAYRGIGTVPEVLEASAAWLKDECNITQIVLGVSRDHQAAIRAYESVGFVAEATPHLPALPAHAMTMVWRL